MPREPGVLIALPELVEHLQESARRLRILLRAERVVPMAGPSPIARLARGGCSFQSSNRVAARGTGLHRSAARLQAWDRRRSRPPGRAHSPAATLRNPEDQETIARGQTIIQTLLSGVRLKALERKRGAVISLIRGK